MKNSKLALDYIRRAKIRLKAIEVLFAEESWADVVRECQEVVELSLKGLLRHCQQEVPRVHDVSPVLLSSASALPLAVQKALPRVVEISKSLRRDRELAFYGSEDLVPAEFYSKKDATETLSNATFIVDLVIDSTKTSPTGRRKRSR